MQEYLSRSKKKYLELKKEEKRASNKKKEDFMKRMQKKKIYTRRFRSLRVKPKTSPEAQIAWGADQTRIKLFETKSNERK